MRALDPFLPSGKALEMGCYTGDVTELLAARYHDVTVIEASGELVAAASARLGRRARFVHGRFETVDLVERYDAIFLIHTLKHLTTRSRCCAVSTAGSPTGAVCSSSSRTQTPHRDRLPLDRKNTKDIRQRVSSRSGVRSSFLPLSKPFSS